ncbi:MAG: helix-turn-helix domain-containing protein [Actinomycetota bacterium]|nr:helix-turn-helix domain-containing protein [Actinomycetota bacterium]
MTSKVRDLRKGLRISRNELARRAGLTAQTVARAEKGEPVSELTQEKLSAVFELPVESVFPD